MTRSPSDLRAIARALGGKVSGHQVLAPGPGHGPLDESMSVRFSASAPEGFVAFSFAGDDFAVCRDHVKARLGIERDRTALRRPYELSQREPKPRQRSNALSLWRTAVDPRGTLAELYLRSRDLALDDDIAGHVLRWHPGIGAMLALFRNIETDKPQAISRTFLDKGGHKLGRKFLGPVGGAAIKLDADDTVTVGLHIGEGVETCMAARQFGLKPAWALGSCGAVAAFPVLFGVECLTLVAENDTASARTVETCAKRWIEAGKEALINYPLVGKDLNDGRPRR